MQSIEVKDFGSPQISLLRKVLSFTSQFIHKAKELWVSRKHLLQQTKIDNNY